MQAMGNGELREGSGPTWGGAFVPMGSGQHTAGIATMAAPAHPKLSLQTQCLVGSGLPRQSSGCCVRAEVWVEVRKGPLVAVVPPQVAHQV